MPSLGRAQPTYGSCHSWFGYHVEDGRFGDVSVSDLNVVMMLEVPGRMDEGNWTVAFYHDERASEAQRDALGRVFGGRAGGPSRWISRMIAREIAARVVPIRFNGGDREWLFEIPRILEGTIEAEPGLAGDGLVRLTNSRYWMSPDVVIGRGKRSRFRDHGRNWNFTAQSAEYGRFDWSGGSELGP
jgi:hypothetical protein